MAQVVVYAARPVLTRLFTPDEFGALTLFVTLAAVVGSLATGHYDDAGLLPESREEAAGLFTLAFLLASIGSLGLLTLLPFREAVANLFETPALASALMILPVGTLFLTWGLIFERWHTRHDRFGLVAGGRFVQSCVVVGFQVIAGVAGIGAYGLIGGVVAGFGALCVVVGVPIIVQDGGFVRSALSLGRLRELGNRYRRFPLFSTPAAFLGLAASRVAILLLAVFFGSTTVGLFGLAFGTLALPVGMVTSAVGQVFAVRAPVAYVEERLGPLSEHVFARLVAVALFPMAAIALAGPELFGWAFGAPWREAGVYARILAPWLFVLSVASPLTHLFDVTERQKEDLAFSALLLIAQVVALALASASAQPRLAVAAVALAGLISRCAQLGWMLHIAGADVAKSLLALAKHLLVATFLLAPTAAVVLAGLHLAWIILALTGGGVIYAYAIIRMDWQSSQDTQAAPRESNGT